MILASGSPQRRILLAEAGYQFAVMPPGDHVECGICSTGGPAALVVELAVEKAASVAARLTHGERPAEGLPGDGDSCLIIACDTVAECGGEVLGKPSDETHAASMLERLRGNRHRVYSGLCLWPWSRGSASGSAGDAESNADSHSDPRAQVAVSELFMEPVADELLDDYLASGLWRGKAGAFGYQDRHGWLRLESGSESNVIGLPMELLAEMLAAG